VADDDRDPATTAGEATVGSLVTLVGVGAAAFAKTLCVGTDSDAGTDTAETTGAGVDTGAAAAGAAAATMLGVGTAELGSKRSSRHIPD
jgi:hypothetical protein